MSAPSTKCSFRIPDDVLRDLGVLAKAEERNLSSLVVRALRQYVKFGPVTPARPAPKRRGGR